MEFVFYIRPQPDLLPQEKEQQIAVFFCLRLTVRQIQSHVFPSRLRTILLLLGEKAGLREVVQTNWLG
jgi:hypothetical protein